jgi:hypothetical protein
MGFTLWLGVNYKNENEKARWLLLVLCWVVVGWPHGLLGWWA